jgi:GNAT superfamily N-acetyltransferase
MSLNIHIQKGEPGDIPALFDLIKELAIYEKAGDEVSVSKEELLNDGFGTNPYFEFFTAKDDQGDVLGIALYYIKYSTWKGKALYLEDIVVKEQYRQSGIGSLLFKAVKAKAKELQVRRMDWQVLEWNAPAIEFYRKFNAELDEEWINCRFREVQINQ